MDVGDYDAVRERIASVVRFGDPDAPVPACPAWRVRDVIAHLAGLCEDWTAHRLGGYASDEWTASQVARFDGMRVADVLQRWQDNVEAFARLGDEPGMGPPVRWAFGDAIVHEADIRGALDAGRVPPDAVLLALKGSIARWRETLAQAGTATLLVRAPDAREWWLGPHDDPTATVVDVPAYELFRALAGRRTIEQVRSWSWSANPDPYIVAGLPYPFHWASTMIVD